MICFMKDITMIVNHHKLIFDGVSFLFCLNKYIFLLSLSADLGICCSAVQSMKAIKPGKYFSTSSSGVCSLCHIAYFLWKWYALSDQTFYFLNVPANIALILNQTKSQPTCRLCKDDSKQVASEICF